jgi:hypothetical protein
MIENPHYKNLYFNAIPSVTIKKTSAMGPTMVSAVYESTTLIKRRAKNKIARKTRKVNKKRRRG